MRVSSFVQRACVFARHEQMSGTFPNSRDVVQGDPLLNMSSTVLIWHVGRMPVFVIRPKGHRTQSAPSRGRESLNTSTYKHNKCQQHARLLRCPFFYDVPWGPWRGGGGIFTRPLEVILRINVVVGRRGEREAHGTNDPVGENDCVEARRCPRLGSCRAGRHF